MFFTLNEVVPEERGEEKSALNIEVFAFREFTMRGSTAHRIGKVQLLYEISRHCPLGFYAELYVGMGGRGLGDR